MIILLEIKDMLKIEDYDFSFVIFEEFVNVGQQSSDLSSEKAMNHSKRFRNLSFTFSFFLILKLCKPDVEVPNSLLELLLAIRSLASSPSEDDRLRGSTKNFAGLSHPVRFICQRISEV